MTSLSYFLFNKWKKWQCSGLTLHFIEVEGGWMTRPSVQPINRRWLRRRSVRETQTEQHQHQLWQTICYQLIPQFHLKSQGCISLIKQMNHWGNEVNLCCTCNTSVPLQSFICDISLYMFTFVQSTKTKFTGCAWNKLIIGQQLFTQLKTRSHWFTFPLPTNSVIRHRNTCGKIYCKLLQDYSKQNIQDAL